MMSHKNGTSSPGESWKNGKIDNHQESFHMELNEASSDSVSVREPCVEEICVRQIVRRWESELPSRRATSIGNNIIDCCLVHYGVRTMILLYILRCQNVGKNFEKYDEAKDDEKIANFSKFSSYCF